MPQKHNTADSSTQHDPYLPFRYRTYRLYLGGWLIAMFGTRIQSVAIAWEMYQRTGEPLSLGLVGLAQALPTMLFAIPAGYLADAMSRRKLVMISLGAMTVTSLALAFLSIAQGPVLWMYILLFLDASAVTLGRPARTAIVPRLVPPAVFPSAVTWNTSLMQIASVAGPALGGLLIATFNPSIALFCSAASSFLFILMLSRLELAPPLQQPNSATFETLMGGIRFVWEKRLVLALMSLDMFAVLLGGAVYLLPIFAKDILKVGATGFGWLEAAPAAGALCMALTLAHRPPMKHAGRNLLLAIGGFGVATIIFGLSTSFWLSMFMLFLTGALDNISMVIRHTLVQLLTPDHMRGRVSAVNQVFVGASNEIGGFESGLVAQYFGPIVSVVSGGIGTIGVVIMTAILAPGLRNFGALTDAVTEAESASEQENSL